MIANDSLGDKIRAWRQKKGLTQQKLALQAGLETPHYSRIERDLHSPTMDTLDKIATALEITTVELIQGPPKGGEEE